jgi:starch synthase
VKIAIVSSEVTPFSRTGILGDSVGGLAKGLAQNGHSVHVIAPRYLCLDDTKCGCQPEGELTVTAGHNTFTFQILKTIRDGVEYVFLKNDELYARWHIYGSGDFDYSDNDIRFGMFSLASLEYMRRSHLNADIIHCHEWPTGLVPVYRNLFYDDITAKMVFTAHDISFQGIFGKFSVQELGLPWKVYNIEELEYYEGISFLKGGMVHADYITVPSPTYEKDIQTEEYSQGLGLLLADLSTKLKGILGGIDYDTYNPLNDPHLAAMYCAENIGAKQTNKEAFLKETGLSDASRPLFMVDTKFTERKGLELIAQSAEELSKLEANFAFFGYGESHLCNKFKEIANKHDNIFTHIGSNERLVHLGYGAADFILRPSQYEPSGNSHLKGMRYGALPVVSKTGGHMDSVTDIADGGYGFFIGEYGRSALQEQINRAIAFFSDAPILTECRKRVMQIDFSWKTASLKYIELYGGLLGGCYES